MHQRILNTKWRVLLDVKNAAEKALNTLNQYENLLHQIGVMESDISHDEEILLRAEQKGDIAQIDAIREELATGHRRLVEATFELKRLDIEKQEALDRFVSVSGIDL